MRSTTTGLESENFRKLLVFTVTPSKGNQKINNSKKKLIITNIKSRSLSLNDIPLLSYLPQYSPQIYRAQYCGAHMNGHQHGGRKSKKTSGTHFCYKAKDLFQGRQLCDSAIFIGYRNNRYSHHKNPYISKVYTPTVPMLLFRAWATCVIFNQVEMAEE